MCSARVALRWYKKGSGEMYTYLLFYAVAAGLLYLGLRFVLWLSLSTLFSALAGFFCWRWIQRQRTARCPEPKWPKVMHGFFTTRDNLKIHYQLMGATKKHLQHHPHQKLLVIANGLGGALFFFEPLVARFVAKGWAVVTWDYRGLFKSGVPLRQRRLAVPEHAEDLRELLDTLGRAEADVFLGWSTGVQVGLEFAALHPERVHRLVLLNGTHGKVFQTAFQPFFRVPMINDFLHWFIDTLVRHLRPINELAAWVWRHKYLLQALLLPYGLIFGSPRLEEMAMMYLRDVFGTGPVHIHSYLRMFQELDAHSVFHLLPSIEHPTFIISGFLDYATPAYQSFEMCNKMPNAWHVCHLFGSHFLIGEYPDSIPSEIEDFVEGRIGKAVTRTGAATFSRVATPRLVPGQGDQKLKAQ